MKKLSLILVAFALSLSSTFAGGHKYALIIAIGNYNQELTGWYPISADHDVPLIQKTLQGLGFKDEDITYLKDDQATKEGMMNAFNELLAKVGEGDEVVIHYSGHGHQIFDDNGDEIDGLDECLVCYDAPMKMVEGYKGEKHFRDDELGQVVERFRIKLGKDGHLLLFLDSCHSGTGTRGAAKVRGGAPALVPEGWHAPSGAPKLDGKVGMGMGATNSRGAVDVNNLAKYVVFSGASANELNYETFDDEGTSVGSLSYCIFKSFSQMKEGDTYRQVFARIMAEMASKAPFQNPAIEGDVDYSVFGGDFTTQAEYFNMTSVKNDSIITINAGRLVGVNPGTTIAFVAPGTSHLDESTPVLVSGRVVSATNFNSKVKLDVKTKFKTNQDAWVFVKARTFTDQKVKVSIDPEMDPALKKALDKQIEESSFAELNTDAPEITLNYGRTRGAKVISVNNAMYNQELHKISNIDETALESDVMSTLNNFAQGKIIKDL
ncbi:MAG: caspase family protein, partial [Bacteroidales bacterium]|nr:caspase family protein [Bacteroidales bacterium]